VRLKLFEDAHERNKKLKPCPFLDAFQISEVPEALPNFAADSWKHSEWRVLSPMKLK